MVQPAFNIMNLNITANPASCRSLVAQWAERAKAMSYCHDFPPCYRKILFFAESHFPSYESFVHIPSSKIE